MALKGTFDVMSFQELLTVLAKNRATGRLYIRRRSGGVSVAFESGQLVDAVMGNGSSNGSGDLRHRLEEVYFELLDVRSGSFEFKPETVDGSAGNPLRVDALLARARRLEERRRIEAMRDHRPKPIVDPGRDKVTLTRDQWRLVMAADGRRSIRDIAKTLGRSESAVCMMVNGLLEKGVLELLDPSPEPAGDDSAPAPLESVLALLRDSDPVRANGSTTERAPQPATERNAETPYRPVRALIAVTLGVVYGLWLSVITRFRVSPGPIVMFAGVMLILVTAELIIVKRRSQPVTRPRIKLNGIAEFVLVVVLVLAVDFVLESVVVKRYRTSSSSMAPTIQVGDQLLIDRLTLRFHPPHRGDVVIFNPPAGSAINACGVDHSPDQACPLPTSGRLATVFVKRVVGLPGDTVTIAGGRAYVNGKLQRDPSMPHNVACDICDLPLSITVPPGHFFVMGDNRDHSNDSRVWGPVPSGWLIGRVLMSYWPLGRFGIF
jgi:signal peptidase I